MKDKLRYFLYKLSRYKIINQFYKYYYHVGIFTVQSCLFFLPFVKHAYLKGSFGKNYFVPVISDLDFYIIGNTTKTNEAVIKFLFSTLNLFFPIISDYDFHSARETNLLFDYSGAKYFSTTTWKTLKGRPVDFTYRFYPRKFYVDMVHEVYFQCEWLFINLKDRRPGDKLKSLSIQRQYLKITDLINHLALHSTDYDIKKRKFFEDTRWIDLSNEQIIKKFNKLIENSYFIRRITDIYKCEFLDRNVDEILKEEYYQKELTLIDGDFVHEGKAHYFTRRNFELFYFLGCIDSFLIYDWCTFTKDNLGAKYLKALYYTRLIEKRGNSKHSKEYYFENVEDAQYISSTIAGAIRFEQYAPQDYFDKDVLINVSDVVDSTHRKYLEGVNKYIPVLSINLSKEKPFEKREFCELIIAEQNTYDDVPNKESLFQIGVHWCFGANIVILSSGNSCFKPMRLITDLKQRLNEHDFIRYVQPPHDNFFLWAGLQQNWASIELFVDTHLGTNANEYMFDLLTGIIPSSLKNHIVDNIVKKFHTYDFTVDIIKEKELITHYVQNEKAIKIRPFLSLLHHMLKRNDLGILIKKDPLSNFWIWYFKITNPKKNDPYETLWFISDFIKKYKIKKLDDFILSQSEFWQITGPGLILESSDSSITFRTADLDKKVPIQLKYIFSEEIEGNSLLEWYSTFDNNISDEKMDVVLGRASSDDYRFIANLEGDELFNSKLMIIDQIEDRPLEICFRTELLPNKTYYMRRDKLTISEDMGNYSFVYYKKLSPLEARSLELGLLCSGLFKIVVELNEKFRGSFSIKDNKSGCVFQKFNVNDKTLVLYHHNRIENQNLSLYCPKEFDVASIREISILECTNLL
jgi:hypothetical protein